MFASAFNPDVPSRTALMGAPEGHDARVVAEIAVRTHGHGVLWIAADEVRAAVIADALAFFAPEATVVPYPAWDCLPYDRTSPHADITGQRLAALVQLGQSIKAPTIILATVASASQRVLPPEALHGACLDIAVGDTLPLEKLRHFLVGNGYVQSSTVREAGEFAIRGGIADIFPSAHDAPLRIDFFGDDVESLRCFDPITQITSSPADSLHLRPVTEVMLNERTIAAFRSGYRELFGAVTNGDPLYAAVTAGRKFPGVEHWLPLFYNRLATIFDYVPTAPIILDWQLGEAFLARRQQIDDFYQARMAVLQGEKRNHKRDSGGGAVYNPVPPERLYISDPEWQDLLAPHAVAELSPLRGSEEQF